MKNLILIMLALIISACSSEEAGLAELRKLCEKDAGLTIYKTVEADGYYDDTGGFDLVLSPYKFYEFCDDSPSPSKFNVIPEPGCYRVEKVKRVAGVCHQGYDDALAKVVVDPYPEFLKKYCIAVEKIEKPTTKYSYHDDFKKWYSKNKSSKFTRSDVCLKNNDTDEVLGRYVSYSYNLRPGHSTAKSCEIFEGDYPSFTESNLINTVIQPVEGKTK
jgi:hypothetical protein